MLIRFTILLSAFLAASCAEVQAEDTPKPDIPIVSSGEIVWWPDFAPAEAVGVDNIWIWLPPSYASQPGKRFPVLYMHDAENLFDRRLSNFDKEWGMDEAITRMAARGDLREWILVGLSSPENRYQTLFPQKLFGLLPESYQQGVTGIEMGGIEAGFPLRGDEYAKVVAVDLKAKIDSEFRTLTTPEDTAVMGSSMGGLISLYIIAEYPDVFGQAAGVSTHLPLTGPEGGDPDERATQVSEAFRQYFSESEINPARNRIYVDHGTGTLDAFYPPYFKQFDGMMAELGWQLPAYESRVFFGAEHEENAWAQRVDIPLSFLDAKDP
ncbi:alpha/beta hydrolase [Erythrobacter sp. YT30]|uniref:alpha/beta hydrolase n=1 Tax=Erythrobacter sp. YT30 TaxID=1735012 RepID=UPI00076CE036|nr:alpha/beta hydrolase-fold protein [Erythrobacter sp. YT30]KWV90539.1 hypothetical protein AUC45_15010 [Erythrobacter sp. YT30]